VVPLKDETAFFCAMGVHSDEGCIESFESLTQLATIPSLRDPLYVYACIEDKRGGFIFSSPPSEIEYEIISQAHLMKRSEIQEPFL